MSEPAPEGSGEADAAAGEPLAVPHAQLSPAALRGLIEAFVLREGTDYGAREVVFETKVAQVAAQLERGEAQIWFDPSSSSVDIIRTAAGR
jgi:uncharacterized protein YheU (UPF0270 family)